MAVVPITAAPITADNPSFIIDYDEVYGDAVQLQCAAVKIEAQTSEKKIDLRTLCGPEDEKTVTRVNGYTVEVKLSFGDGVGVNPLGLYQATAAKFNKLVTYAAVFDHTLPVSSANLETSGRLYFPTLPSFSVVAADESVPLTFTMNTFQQTVQTDDPLAQVIAHPLGA